MTEQDMEWRREQERQLLERNQPEPSPQQDTCRCCDDGDADCRRCPCEQ